MPSQRGNANIVEVRPSNVASNIAPTSPPASPNTKKARFAPTVVDGVTRPLHRPEAWSLYNFETHAQKCSACYDPLARFSKGERLCSTGHALAQDVSEHVYYQAGEVYGKDPETENSKPERVELQRGYVHSRSLLQAMDRARSRARTVPIISYDRTYPAEPRRNSSPSRPRREEREEPRRDSVVIEPSITLPSRRRTSHKTTRYRTVPVEEDVEPTTERKSESRKGLLYDADLERRKKEKAYVVEIREPSSRNRDRERERRREGDKRTGYYYG